jgi:archaellum component FlaG (FlaF/FlaG flagellin family)
VNGSCTVSKEMPDFSLIPEPKNICMAEKNKSGSLSFRLTNKGKIPIKTNSLAVLYALNTTYWYEERKTPVNITHPLNITIAPGGSTLITTDLKCETNSRILVSVFIRNFYIGKFFECTC